MAVNAGNGSRIVVALTWTLAAVGCSNAPAPYLDNNAPVVGVPPMAGVGMAAAGTLSPMPVAGTVATPTTVAGSGGRAAVPPVTPMMTAGSSAAMPMAGSPSSASDDDAGVMPPSDAGMPRAGAPAPTAGAPAPATHEDLGKGDGHDVITIGDSWMSLGTGEGIQESLLKASGQRYRTYGVPGTQLLNGQIPGQFTRAKMANPDIKTVVMTGGGNDILQTGLSAECGMGGPRCAPQLMKIGDGLAALWKQMGQDGVKDVVHIMYAAIAGDGVKDAEANNKALADLCAAATPVRCHLLNTDMLIPTEGDLRDGIHPKAAGYDRIGKAVFDLMVKEGMRR